MELLPIITSAVWGLAWRGQRIIVHCDNTGIITVANSGYSRAPRIMHLLQSPFFIWAHFEFSLQAVHIKETDNILADAVSHYYSIRRSSGPPTNGLPSQRSWQSYSQWSRRIGHLIVGHNCLRTAYSQLSSGYAQGTYTGLVLIDIPYFVCFTMSVNHFQ